jgi:hypothetical protein
MNSISDITGFGASGFCDGGFVKFGFCMGRGVADKLIERLLSMELDRPIRRAYSTLVALPSCLLIKKLALTLCALNISSNYDAHTSDIR